MIISHQENHTLSWQMDFRLISAFSENKSYDKSFKLPFNIISCRCEVEKFTESFIRNEWNNECWYPKPNQILFIPYELPIFIHRRPDYHVYVLHFTLEHFPGLDIFCGLRNIFDLSSQYDADELKDIFSETDPKMATSRMYAFVFRICTSLMTEVQERKEWRFLSLTRMVRDNITADWTVDKLAKKASMSTGAFSREFSANMHCTAKQFLQRELLLKATSLLQNSEKNIQSVSKELHFSSPFYFSKFFKKAYGISPSEYLKRYNQNIPDRSRK